MTTRIKTRGAWILILMATLTGCGDAPPVEVEAVCAAIVQGDPSKHDPRSTTESIGSCTGVYIAPGVVLSAAHCPVPEIVQGGNDITDDRVQVIDFVRHPNYDGGVDFDLMILFLQGPLPLEIAPIAWATEGPALVQGYGVDENGITGELRATEVMVEEIYEDWAVSTEGACFGDSGGPLYQNGRLVGITSHTNSSEGCGEGAWHISPMYHAEWIQSEVAGVSFVDPIPSFDGC